MAQRNGKKYIPPKKLNPVLLNRRLEELQKLVQQSRKRKEMEMASLRNHIAKLTNFTSHDMKNAIQNMDSVISIVKLGTITSDNISSIKACLNAMRQSLDDFYRLSPDGRKVQFSINELVSSVEIVNRSAFNENKIKYQFEWNKDEIITIYQSFHNILQVVNNLIINSVASLEKKELERKLCINFTVEEPDVIILVKDNGSLIPSNIRNKIFDMYFSTTGGSGIGLAHASFILENIKGSIKLLPQDKDYCTIFEIKFPIIEIKEEEIL